MLFYLIIFTGIIAVLLPLIVRFYQRIHFYDAYKIPGPPGLPLFGNMFDFGFSIEDFFNDLMRISKKYGTCVRLWQGPKRLEVIISDADYAEQILTSNVHLNKAPGYDGYKPWLGDGLINSKAQIWKRHRKIITPTFHFKILEQFFEVFNTAGNILIDVLKKESIKGAVDIYPLLKLYGLDVICETSMGIKVKAQLNENKDYVYAVEHFLELYMLKYFSLFRRYEWYYRFTSDCQREKKILKTLKDFTKVVIDNRKKERLANKDNKENVNTDSEFGIKKKTAFLDLLLDMKNEDALTDQELNDEVNTFLFAGHDTISTALTFVLFQVAKYPEMQARILEEIHSVVGEDETEPITMQHVQELKYTERFIKEVFRYYTPVPFVERELSDTFEIAGYTLPKGTNVLILAYALHHNEKYFPEPEKFDPDRFLPDAVNKRHPFAYLPFSAGPRNCIGQRFAMLQVKTTFANILRNLEVSAVVPEHKLKLGNNAVLVALNGVPINIKSRK